MCCYLATPKVKVVQFGDLIRVIVFLYGIHITAITIMTLRYDVIGITVGTIFFQLINDKNIDSHSESTLSIVHSCGR